jgi:hypothetical protein
MPSSGGLLLTVLLTSIISYASTVGECNAALVPNIQVTKQNRHVVYAFVKVHAEELFDMWRKDKSGEKKAGAAYKLFEAEYGEAEDSSEFRKNVEARLASEKYLLDAAQSEWLYKRWVAPEQLDAWVSCVALVTGAPYLLVTPALPPGQKTGTLDLRYRPGSDNETISIMLSGAAFLSPPASSPFVAEGKTGTLTVHTDGSYAAQFVSRQESDSDQDLVITVNASWPDNSVTPTVNTFRLPPKEVILDDLARRSIIAFASTYDKAKSKGVQLIDHAGYEVITSTSTSPDSPSSVSFPMRSDEGGAYCLKVKYKAEKSRRTAVYVNEQQYAKHATRKITQGFDSEVFGRVELRAGDNTIELRRKGPLPFVYFIVASSNLALCE